jgi:hypothetical protein
MEFPVTIEKGEFKYSVYDQAALDFHLGQGWAVETATSLADLSAADIEKWGNQKLVELAEQVCSLRDEQVCSLNELTNRVAALEAILHEPAAPVEPTAPVEPAAADQAVPPVAPEGGK